MENQRTCGKGLAEHSSLPAKLAELTASVAENLETHMEALDSNDENARREHDVYLRLASEHRKAATQLQATARQMAGCRDLPMGPHDPKAMSAPRVRDAFEKLVRVEQELLALLEKRVDQDKRMLVEMGGAGGGPG